ncbi:MAG: queuosine precursor transporter [Holosporales bacterium]
MFADLVAFLNTLPPSLLLVVEMALCYSSLLLMLRFFGANGLYAYIGIAVIAANTQVMKAVQFPFYSDAVPLGTIVYASIYLATDILNEWYGRAAAQKAVFLGFAGYLIFTVFIVLALGYSPLTPEQAGEGMAWNLPNHDHLMAIFLPAPAILIASMAAYLISQTNDVYMYAWLRKKTAGKQLWLRNNASSLVSNFIDNAVFSIIAWNILSPNPVTWDAMFYTYILGTYLLRVVISMCDTPFLYLAGRCRPQAEGVKGAAAIPA